MPLRPGSLSFALRPQRLFHTSILRRADSQNHYETLQISPSATPAEVKKSFYSLSKTHHPDRNPNDPNASERFVQISEAYNIIGTPSKRQQYDRDVMRTQQSHSHSHHHPRGSYHSSGLAGGRPASGLSRRRTQFRGPPPSFYRSGGWGEHSAKRQAAQDSTGEANTGSGGGESQRGAAGMGGGMGPGQQPWGHDRENDVPHFDREGHFRTHEKYDKRRQRRMKDHFAPTEETRGTFAQFVFVGSIISLGVFVPSLLFEKFTRKPKVEKT